MLREMREVRADFELERIFERKSKSESGILREMRRVRAAFELERIFERNEQSESGFRVRADF